MSLPTLELETAVALREDGVARLSQLVKGRLLPAPELSLAELQAAAAGLPPAAPGAPQAFRCGDAQVLRLAALEPGTLAPSGAWRYLVLARPDPAELIERDPAALARELHALPTAAVLDLAGRLAALLREQRHELARRAHAVDGGALLDANLGALLFDLLPALLDPQAMGEALDRELGSDGIPGRRFLDGWVELPTRAHRGVMARVADALFERRAAAGDRFRPQTRAVPTRQLHITAGNSPLIPVLSWLRGLLTRGACVVKSPADAVAVTSLLGAALHALDPNHPLVRHTSFVYWPGGDAEIESALLVPGAFDRIVVWGSEATVASVRRRAGNTRTLVLGPKYGVSVIGRGVFPDAVEAAAQRASVDSLVWDQQACTASLVHYVEGDEAQVLDYCAALQRALARWDERLPRPVPRAALGKLRLLQRGPLLRGRWFVNGRHPELRSAVVYAPGPFDLSLHPQTRFVVVRRVERAEDVLALVGPSVASVGVHPESTLVSLRDGLAACGVSNVWPLGESERAWPGLPHDGMRVMSELVAWTSSGSEPGPD